MICSVVCYLYKDGKYLMMYRNRKKNDVNAGKWIGVGGKFEKDETPQECALREIFEETGLTGGTLKYEGIIYFTYDHKETEKIWVYTGEGFEGQLKDCDEGTLEWIGEDDILSLDLWEGDIIFLKKMLVHDPVPFFLELEYDSSDRLTGVWEKETENE
jgi:8-oxo-dGTP diphosphatase